MIPFSLAGAAEEFCGGLDCRDQTFFFHAEDAPSIRSWLQYSTPESIRTNALRNLLLHRPTGWAVSRMTEDAVIEEIVHLLISHRLHVHPKPVQVVARGISTKATSDSVVRASQASGAQPQPRAPQGSSGGKEQIPDTPTFPSSLDGSAQAAVLIAAAAQGQPFCPQ